MTTEQERRLRPRREPSALAVLPQRLRVSASHSGLRRRRRAAGLLLLICLASGCRNDDGRRSVDFWAFGSEGETVRPLLAAFEQENPGIEVRLQQIPWSAAHEKLLTAFVGDAMPDVFQVGNTWLPELVTLGAVARLDDRLSQNFGSGVGLQPGLEEFFPAAVAAAQHGAHTYALPWYVDTRVLFYRSDLLQAAGIEIPDSTWDAWRASLPRLAASHTRDRYPLLLPINEWEAPVILAWRHGAQLLRDGARYGAFREAAFRRGFDEYLAFFRERLAVPPEAPGVDTHADFARGRFGWFLSGPWTVGVLRQRLRQEAAIQWSTLPLPTAADGTAMVSVAGGASLALSPSSDVPEAAWSLMAYLTTAAAQQQFFALAGDLPARRDAWDEAMRTQAPTRAFWQQMQHARTAPRIAEWERIAQAIARQAEAAVRGMRSPEEALRQLDAAVDTILEKRRWLLDRGRLPDDPEAAGGRP